MTATPTPPDRLDRIEAALEQFAEENAQALREFRQEILDGITQVQQAQTSAWTAIAQTNRPMDRVTQNQLQLAQEITRLRAGQEAQQRVLDYLLSKEQERQTFDLLLFSQTVSAQHLPTIGP